MQYTGFTIHHSACPSINGKGYDFLITRRGTIIPSSEPMDAKQLHICLEGDFSAPFDPLSSEIREQLFIATKLILRLCAAYELSFEHMQPHTLTCPGRYFPWAELVLSMSDGYH
ncbi:hypothetical protein [Paenibacillus thermotolerans]|uniref:hypothetical protein n=1 Tax=Paenibacillus thermotolerans TaxID=3027807 RepID=UPI00236873D3|nr:MULTISPECIES: hypothetical protein [unclassified Paenibacillus]